MKRIITISAIFLLLFNLFPFNALADDKDTVQETVDSSVASEEDTGDIEATDTAADSMEEVDSSSEPAEQQESSGTDISDKTSVEMDKQEQSAEEGQETAGPSQQQADKDESDQDEKEKEPVKQEKDDKESAKYNEFGIKEGTMVYGLDISKLSEEQLQYIPIEWRDGVEEEPSFHSSSAQQYSASRVNYPDVNKWIKDHKPATASIKTEHKSFFTKFNYRGGRGAVEGVVAHETANPNSSIRSEINYMSAHHQNAFVHAFVDGGNIIEIHPTDLGAWGAGYYANQRFVHVELVEVNSFEEFAKSINNYADYIAYVLAKYDLGVDSAESDGRGTLWSHNAVSKYLGGTTHVDPHGYFAKYGYQWNDFVKLVKERYDQKSIKYSKTSKLGHIKSANILIYKDVTNLGNSFKASSKYTNQVYYIKKQAVVNGTTYYLLSTQPSSTKNTIGWIKASDTQMQEHRTVNKEKATYTVKGSGKAYNKTWGGSKNLVYELFKFKGAAFEANLTETVGKNTWIRGKLNGKEVWILAGDLSDKRIISNTSRLGHLNKGAKIYTNILISTDYRNASDKDYNQVYYIKQKVEKNGRLYYLISYAPSKVRQLVGWVDSSQMETLSHKASSEKKQTLYIKGNGKSYDKAWGGSKNIIEKNMKQFEGQPFQVNLVEKVNKATWYRGTLNGKEMWLHSAYLSTKTEKRISRLGHLNAGAVILKQPGMPLDAKKAKDGYTNAVYYIKKQAVVNDKTYYLISTKPSSVKGTVGWVDSRQMDTHPHTTYSHEKQTLYVKGTGKSYSKAWGGSKDIVEKYMKKFEGQPFQVNLVEKVNKATWYRGTLNGKEMWLHSAYLSTKTEKRISRLGHLNADAVILKQPGMPLDAKKAKDGYTNAVYYIKKQAVVNDKTYYLISTKPSSVKGTLGWVDSRQMDTHPHTTYSHEKQTLYVKGTGKAYTKAWGGSKDLIYNLRGYKNAAFQVNLIEKVNKATWYRGILNGKEVWIHSAYLKK
ncbi:GW dipeptide domain-containing protein [Terribacillus sp. 179-K 1B1 HS]|uniref:peptidoglycan recognition protein family protein n=1 Tax=Terribacillus sp. 179-K 1B1 HS TaxID=3142388 RepID=UPI0039A17714